MTGLTLLPTTKQSRESLDVTPLNARVMLAGTPKAGKSTLAASWAPDTTLIIDTQHGTDLLDGDHFVKHVANWTEFASTVDALASNEHAFKTVVIDMIDDVWMFVDQHHAGPGKSLATATDDYGRSSSCSWRRRSARSGCCTRSRRRSSRRVRVCRCRSRWGWTRGSCTPR
jgi:hypothetical protein